MGSDLLTAQEVADRFRVSVSTVSRWARQGHLHAIRPAGERGSIRFRREEIEALLAVATITIDEPGDAA